MTIIAYKDQGYTAVSIVTKKLDGSVVSPSTGPLCQIYRAHPTGGTMVKDLDMGTQGEVSLSLVSGSAYLYSAPIDLSAASFELYELLVTYTYVVSQVTTTVMERITLVVSKADTITYRGRTITLGSNGTTFKAPTPVV